GTRDSAELAEAARRFIVPAQLRRRFSLALEPAIFDPVFESHLTTSWSSGTPAAPATALMLRDRIDAYVQRTPRDRAAVVCMAALRPLLADFLLRSGVRVEVFSYGELPAELSLHPAEVIADQALGA
ncbi:MAG: hypothetical protein JO302_02405, partial [Candidatus Eremiobacteraeota bacterium]|nr:hypothetical protein [Candidatus Eremiobacteraeota bacterium]